MTKKYATLQKCTQQFLHPMRLEYAAGRVVIEGCKRVLVYDQNRIVLQTADGRLGFEGDRLRICRLSGDTALLCGHIATIHLEGDTVCG